MRFKAWLLSLAFTPLGGKGFSTEQIQLAPETRRDHSSGFSYYSMPFSNCYYAWCSLPPLHLHYSIVIGTQFGSRNDLHPSYMKEIDYTFIHSNYLEVKEHSHDFLEAAISFPTTRREGNHFAWVIRK